MPWNLIGIVLPNALAVLLVLLWVERLGDAQGEVKQWEWKNRRPPEAQ